MQFFTLVMLDSVRMQAQRGWVNKWLHDYIINNFIHQSISNQADMQEREI